MSMHGFKRMTIY